MTRREGEILVASGYLVLSLISLYFLITDKRP